jgi:hypothetical protein
MEGKPIQGASSQPPSPTQNPQSQNPASQFLSEWFYFVLIGLALAVIRGLIEIILER